MALLSILDTLCREPYRFSLRKQVNDCLCHKFLTQVSNWSVYKTASPFKRRVTALQWHPTCSDVVAAGSHAGDILLWNYEKNSKDPFIEGVGMGYGSITEMRFHPDNPTQIYTASVDGRFCLQDFNGRCSEVYLDTMDIAYWWCSFDRSSQHNVIVVGDNCGSAVLLDSSGQTIGKYKRLHRGKIKHVEFCPSRNWLLATASVDKTVALWDIRMLKTNVSKSTHPDPVVVMSHNAVVSSAYFDPIFGSRLLTTSQNGEIRVYDSHNLWGSSSACVEHSHRNFQHMTDIKATWHPFYHNLCVVGRYPRKEDTDQSRTVDLINLESGETIGCFYSPHLTNIIQLNKFNQFGDSLASGMGYHALIWKAPSEAVAELVTKSKRRPVSVPHSGDTGGSIQRPRKRNKETKDDKAIKMKKIKLQTKTLTRTSRKK